MRFFRLSHIDGNEFLLRPLLWLIRKRHSCIEGDKMIDNQYQIFLSFKDRDENGNRTKSSRFSEKLFHSLTERGYKVFYAPSVLNGMIGQEIAPTIEHALETAKLQIIVLTNSYEVNSKWLRFEWQYFFKNNKPVLPVFLNDGKIDYDSMPPEICDIQGIQISDDFSYKKLIETIESVMSDR